MAPLNNLVDLPNGVAKVSSGAMLLPTAQINTVADVMHDCVGSAGATSTACHNLFTCVVPGAKPGAGDIAPCTPPAGARVPTDTLAATLDIVRNPVNNVAVLFTLVSKTPPYLPKLSAAPNEWNVCDHDKSGGGMDEPDSVAIDARPGNAWVANFGPLSYSVTEISPAGTFLSGAKGYTGGGLSAPAAIAIDPAGNAWVANSAGFHRTLADVKISPSGTFLSGSKRLRRRRIGRTVRHCDRCGRQRRATNLVASSVTKIGPTGVFLSGPPAFRRRSEYPLWYRNRRRR